MPPNTPTGPGARLGHVAGVLERVPRDLEEVAVLRIHELRFERRDAEERRVEQLDVVEHAARRARRPGRRAAPPESTGRARRARRRGSIRGPSHRLLQNASTSARAGEAAGHADDRDGLVAPSRPRVARGCDGVSAGAPSTQRAPAPAGVGAAKKSPAETSASPRVAQPREQRATPTANRRRARRSRRARRRDRGRARSANAAQIAPRGRRAARDTAARARAARAPAAGSAARSSLPLAVTGSAVSAHERRRHHEVGQDAARARRAARAEHRRRRGNDVGDQPLAAAAVVARDDRAGLRRRAARQRAPRSRRARCGSRGS